MIQPKKLLNYVPRASCLTGCSCKNCILISFYTKTTRKHKKHIHQLLHNPLHTRQRKSMNVKWNQEISLRLLLPLFNYSLKK